MTKRRFKKGIQSIILTVIMVLTMVPIDSFTLVTKAANEEVTKTYSLSTYVRADDMLSFSLTDPDDNTSKTVFTADGDNYTHMIRKFGSGIQVGNTLSYDDSPNVRFWVLPNVNGKVTKIEFTKACRVAGQVIVGDHDAWPPTWEDTSFFMSIDGMKYNGTDEALTGDSHLDGKGNTTESENFTFISTDPEGIEGNLSLWLGKRSMFTMLSGCEIKIHYIPAAEPAHEHDFTYSMNGNTLTATCGHSDGKSCSLADSNHQISLSLEAEDAYYQFGYVYPATLLNNSLFASETGATIGNITYRNNTTGEDLGTQKPTGSGEHPTGAGNYTASVTINVGGTTYTLTKDYTLSNFFTINNSYPQFSIGTEQYSVTNRAAENETVTLTFTSQFGETLESLSVIGETINYSLENGITKVDDTHYTFSMPAETVTIDASFTYNISIDNTIQHGSVTASVGTTENATTATNGDTVILNVTPDEGYELESLVVKLGGTDTAVTVSGEGNSRYFTMPASNVTVAATWKKLQTNSDIFSGHSLLLTGQIGVEFLITLPEEMDAQGCYMTFSGNQIDGNYRAAGQAIGNNRYQYIVYIPAYQMADKITPTFHYFENEVETTIVGEAYSAEDYIKWGLTNLTDERELNVIRALADYGYYSQIYLSGFNNWTIGTDYAEMKTRYSTSFNYNTVRTELASYAVNSDIADLSYRLNFGSTTRLDIRFTAGGGETVELDGVEKTPDTDGNYSLVSVSGIPASQLTTGHTLQVGEKTATISPMSYAYTLLGRTNESNELKNLLCAFYNYGNACAAYNQN